MTDHLISSKAFIDACRRCRRPTLVALSEGLRACVDLIELDVDGELDAILANRETYTLTGGELVYRDPGRIAGSLTGPVLPQHQCVSGGKVRQQ